MAAVALGMAVLAVLGSGVILTSPVAATTAPRVRGPRRSTTRLHSSIRWTERAPVRSVRVPSASSRGQMSRSG